MRPRAREVRHEGDAVGFGLVGDAGEFGIVLRLAWRLEGNRAGDDASVKLGQHHIHGEIDRAEATAGGLPLGAAGGGEDRLKHWRIGAVEHADAAIFAARERRGVEDYVGRDIIEKWRKFRHCGRIFQAGDGDASHRKAALAQGVGECDQRRRIISYHHRAIGDDQRARRLRGRMAAGGVE